MPKLIDLCGHRYYDPETGRYLAPDPIGLAGGINLFVYANSNPIFYYDSNGKEVAPFAGLDFWETEPQEITVTFELGLGIRAWGYIIWQCCDDSNNMWRHTYWKNCSVFDLGVAMSISPFPLFNSDFCSNPPNYGTGLEFGISSPLGGVEHGGPFDHQSFSGGISYGADAKLTSCKYHWLSSNIIDECCKQ